MKLPTASASKQEDLGPRWILEPWTTGGLAALRAGNPPGPDDPGPAAHELARRLITKSIHTAAITQ